jgi:hypothetical protein
MSSQIQNYSLVTLNDRVVPGFAGIMCESVRTTGYIYARWVRGAVSSQEDG